MGKTFEDMDKENEIRENKNKFLADKKRNKMKNL